MTADQFEALAVSMWGEFGNAKHAAAIEALQEFGTATGCPPGGNVIEWFGQQHVRLIQEHRRILDEEIMAQIKEPPRPPIPVDRSARTLTDGKPIPDDGSHLEIKPNGQQAGYVVLSAEERDKGFVRPVRQGYVHSTCGTLTTMGRALAETYARDPKFYSGTFCAGCGKHFPVGEDGEFVWDGTTEKVGT